MAKISQEQVRQLRSQAYIGGMRPLGEPTPMTPAPDGNPCCEVTLSDGGSCVIQIVAPNRRKR